MKFLWFALVAVVIVAARPDVEKSSGPVEDGKTSPPCEPGCIGNYQPCIDSIKPCCRLEDRTSVTFGREEYICDRFFGGLCAPLAVISNLTLYIELSGRLNETNLSELSHLYFEGAIAKPKVKPESKMEDGGKVEEVNKGSTEEMELGTTGESAPESKPASEMEASQCEPGCIGNYQPCIDSIKPCCRLEDRTSVQFGRKEYICDRFLGGLCAPLEVITNLPLYLELSIQLNETNLLELSKLYWADVFATPKVKPESKIEDGGKAEEVAKGSTEEMELRTTGESAPESKTASGMEHGKEAAGELYAEPGMGDTEKAGDFLATSFV